VFQFTFVSGVPCTVQRPDGLPGQHVGGFQFTFVSGVPCTCAARNSKQLQPSVSIHLREWGALHQPSKPESPSPYLVSIHLREWGALHPPRKEGSEMTSMFQFTFVSGVPCTTTTVTTTAPAPIVSIHLREWGALHRHLHRDGHGQRVSIHLREWGALHRPHRCPLSRTRLVSIHLREWGALHPSFSSLVHPTSFNSPS